MKRRASVMGHYEASGPVSKVAVEAVTGAAQTLVGAIAGKKIRLLSFAGGISADGTVKFLDDAGTPHDLTGAIPFKAAAPSTVLGYQPSGWGETGAGQALKVTISAGAISGVLVYQLID
jgi:hypothetical protein